MTGASAIDSTVLGDLFGTAAMRAVFSDHERVQAMLDVEAALARAEAATGVIPKEAAPAIAAACRADQYDLAEIGRLAILGANPAIPLVKMLTEKVAGDARRLRPLGRDQPGHHRQRHDAPGPRRARYSACRKLRRSPTPQRNSPRRTAKRRWRAAPSSSTRCRSPFGYKAAVWLGLAASAHARLAGIRRNGLALQFGGAAGTLASLGGNGAKVAEALARELNLPLPDMPWHSARDRIADIGAAVAIAAGSAGKIATDIALLMQTEVAEVFEPAGEGKGGSSDLAAQAQPSRRDARHRRRGAGRGSPATSRRRPSARARARRRHVARRVGSDCGAVRADGRCGEPCARCTGRPDHRRSADALQHRSDERPDLLRSGHDGAGTVARPRAGTPEGGASGETGDRREAPATRRAGRGQNDRRRAWARTVSTAPSTR